MPIYDYKCTSCKTVTTVSHSITTDFYAICKCGSPMRKIFTPPPIHFKGDGFNTKKG